MFRASQRRHLLRQAYSLPPELIAQLPDAERALFLRMKERLEQKRRQGNEWIGVTGSDVIHDNKLMKKTKKFHGGSNNNKSTFDAPSVHSAVTEDLTIYSSSASRIGCDGSSDSDGIPTETFATNLSQGLSFEEFSCSNCACSCCFDQECDHRHPNNLLSQYSHDSLAPDDTTIQSGSNMIICEDCGCLSLSSSLKQEEETEIVFDSDLYRNLKSHRMLFATPFLREQHMKVLLPSDSLHDQATCSVLSHEYDTEDEHSYSGFFLDEFKDLDVHMINSSSSTSAARRKQILTAVSKNAEVAKVAETPAAFRKAVRCCNSAYCQVSTDDDKPGIVCCLQKDAVKDGETAHDCSSSAFSLEEIFPLPLLHVQTPTSKSVGSIKSNKLDGSEGTQTTCSDPVAEPIKNSTCCTPGDISCSKFFLTESDTHSSKPKRKIKGYQNIGVARKGRGEATGRKLNRNLVHHKMSDGIDFGNIFSPLSQITSISTSKLDDIVGVVDVHVMDDGFDGSKESNLSDVSWPAADEILIGEIDGTGNDYHQSALDTRMARQCDPVDRDVQSSLATFDSLQASWAAARACSRSSAVGDETKDFNFLDDTHNGNDRHAFDKEVSGNRSKRAPTMLASLRNCTSLYDDVAAKETAAQRGVYYDEVYISLLKAQKYDAFTDVADADETILERKNCVHSAKEGVVRDTRLDSQMRQTTKYTRLQISFDAFVSPKPDPSPAMTRAPNRKSKQSKGVHEAKLRILVDDVHGLRVIVPLQTIP